MPKTFTYSQDGLSYDVVISVGEDGNLQATITVTEGSMDINAVYWGDDDHSEPSANLGGPLNMNGEGSLYEGERIQWDGGEEVSRPGLRGEGSDKHSFIDASDSDNNSFTVDLPAGLTLDDIDFFGIRATSVNGGGSIKGVSGDPEIDDPEEPDEPDEPDEPGDDITHGKILFDGFNWVFPTEPDPNEWNFDFLPEGSEGTFADYLAYLEDNGVDPSTIGDIFVYDADNEPLFTLSPPEGGWGSLDDIADAYDNSLAVQSTGLPLVQGDPLDDDELEEQEELEVDV